MRPHHDLEFMAELIRRSDEVHAHPERVIDSEGKFGRLDYLLYHGLLATDVVTIAVQHARRVSSTWRQLTS